MSSERCSSSCGASWSRPSRDPDFERPSLATRQTANCVQTKSADASSSHRKSALVSWKLRHCISQHDFSSSSALRYKQSTIRTAPHASEVWFWPIIFVFIRVKCWSILLGPFHGAIAVLSVTRCRCRRRCRCRCRVNRCAGDARQYASDIWWIGVWRLVEANGPNIFQMLLVLL